MSGAKHESVKTFESLSKTGIIIIIYFLFFEGGSGGGGGGGGLFSYSVSKTQNSIFASCVTHTNSVNANTAARKVFFLIFYLIYFLYKIPQSFYGFNKALKPNDPTALSTASGFQLHHTHWP